jgi:hypothetical protein
MCSRGFRADNTGRVLLSDLPEVYLVGLHLAPAETSRPPDDFARLQRQSLAASEVAREAEVLDEK